MRKNSNDSRGQLPLIEWLLKRSLFRITFHEIGDPIGRHKMIMIYKNIYPRNRRVHE